MLRQRFILPISSGLAAAGIVALLLVGYGLYILDRGTIRDCGLPRLTVSAWEDTDGDSQWWPNEPLLAGVVISIPDNYYFDRGGVTELDGFVQTSREIFAPCDLWWRRAIARPPAGFVGTPPTIIDGYALTYTFGFRRAP